MSSIEFGFRELENFCKVVELGSFSKAAGELLHKHATLILDMKETAQSEMEKFLGLKQADISIGGSTIPGEYIFPALISKFNKK